MDLRHGAVRIRPLTVTDARAWAEIRARNEEWLRPWEATVPPGATPAPASFRAMLRELRRQVREGRSLPAAVEVGGALAGQVTVSSIVGGSAQYGQIGYWVDERHAGQGVAPVAVALTVDFCFQVVGLHRVEIAIRPENRSSLRVVEKLRIDEIGTAPRYLHIDGAWRDHRLFAVTAEEVPRGLLARYVSDRGNAGPGGTEHGAPTSP